ncbi:MAG: CpsB/CapC family capsule biosynthesis tyrosine phosphatase [Bacteroidota bacterium]
MLNFFKKKEDKNAIKLNYQSVVVDMHSHILPGIDDGAQNVAESIFLVKKMMSLGIKKIIATPHIMADYYRNNPETINNALDILKAELKNQAIDIEVEAAAEHYFDEVFEELIDKHQLMTMGDNYVLFEYSFISAPINAFEVIKKMIALGYKPILAHPERYAYLTVEQMANLRGWGCNMQVNTIALTGYYGKEVKKKAEIMIDASIVDFIASDMHHPKHAGALQNALNFPYVQELLTNYPLKNVMLR